jgi:cytidine deaminase
MKDNILIKLKEEAKRVQKNAYVPYSKFSVGATLISDNENIYSGCNVENASYGLTVCAERSAICEMIKNGDTKIKKLVIIGDSNDYVFPCGACRQVIAEFADNNTEIFIFNGAQSYKRMSMYELLPYAFELKK